MVVTVGAGGKFVEALDDVAVLIAPFSQATAQAALASLRIAPLLASLRGEPAIDAGAIAALMLRLAEVMAAASPAVAAIDLNPVLAARGGGLVIADALIEYAQGTD